MAPPQQRPGNAVSRPDLILGGVPLCFLGTFVLSRWLVSSQLFALSAGSLVCLGLLVDGLFLNPPRVEQSE